LPIVKQIELKFIGKVLDLLGQIMIFSLLIMKRVELRFTSGIRDFVIAYCEVR
jgi:hypothetical protein